MKKGLLVLAIMLGICVLYNCGKDNGIIVARGFKEGVGFCGTEYIGAICMGGSAITSGQNYLCINKGYETSPGRYILEGMTALECIKYSVK